MSKTSNHCSPRDTVCNTVISIMVFTKFWPVFFEVGVDGRQTLTNNTCFASTVGVQVVIENFRSSAAASNARDADYCYRCAHCLSVCHVAQLGFNVWGHLYVQLLPNHCGLLSVATCWQSRHCSVVSCHLSAQTSKILR